MSAKQQAMVTSLDLVTSRRVHTLFVEFIIDPQLATFDKVWSGTPQWGQDVAEVFKGGRFSTIVEGTGSTTKQLLTMTHLFDSSKPEWKGRPPLIAWHHGYKRRVFVDKHTYDTLQILAPFADVPLKDFKFHSRFTYHDFDQYGTVVFIGNKLEHLQNKTAIQAYEADTHKLVMVPIIGGSDRVYVAYLLPPNSDLRITEGAQLKVYLGTDDPEDADHARRPWSARVASMKMNFGPQDHIPVYVRCYFDKSTATFDEFQPHIATEAAQAFLMDASDLIESDIGNKVRVKGINPNKTFKRKMNAIEIMSFPPSGQSTNAMEHEHETTSCCRH